MQWPWECPYNMHNTNCTPILRYLHVLVLSTYSLHVPVCCRHSPFRSSNARSKEEIDQQTLTKVHYICTCTLQVTLYVCRCIHVVHVNLINRYHCTIGKGEMYMCMQFLCPLSEHPYTHLHTEKCSWLARLYACTSCIYTCMCLRVVHYTCSVCSSVVYIYSCVVVVLMFHSAYVFTLHVHVHCTYRSFMYMYTYTEHVSENWLMQLIVHVYCLCRRYRCLPLFLLSWVSCSQVYCKKTLAKE